VRQKKLKIADSFFLSPPANLNIGLVLRKRFIKYLRICGIKDIKSVMNPLQASLMWQKAHGRLKQNGA